MQLNRKILKPLRDDFDVVYVTITAGKWRSADLYLDAIQNDILTFGRNAGMTEMMYKDEVYAIQGAIFEVYRAMGNMWSEEVYQQCLGMELEERQIPYSAKTELPIFYKGRKIAKSYIPDVICYGKIVLELKACQSIADDHRRQILNYLRMTGCHLGLLVNFGSYPKVEIERFAL